jgi:phosphoglycerol transferase MdoB-like AlkP superfamily enzyme
MKGPANLFLAYFILAIIMLAVFLGYYGLSCKWSDFCKVQERLFYFEFPVFCLIGLLFYVPGLKLIRNFLAALAAALPLIALYAVFDVFYDLRHHALRLSDIRDLRALWDVNPAMFMVLVAGITTAIFPSVFLLVKRIKEKGILTFEVALRLVLTPVIIFFVFTPVAAMPYEDRFLAFVSWSDYENIMENGRLASVVYYSNMSTVTAENLAHLDTRTVPNPLSVKTANWKKRNIHIVMLESFMDPRYLRQISFSRPPLYEKLPQILGNSHFNVAISPIYGGDTAQAEFEILCGAPGLEKIGGAEFNFFNGGQVNSLVTTLKQHGYASVASIASKPIFFNAALAYQSIGFDEAHFAGLGDTYRKIGEGTYIFDGDLLEQNLEFIQSRYIAAGRPVINYVLGLYGHWPYERDLERHPDMVAARIKGQPVDEINEISNQFYYRTQAIYHFLAKLRQIDPDGIVLIIADHLPPVLNQDVHYSMDEHDSIFVLFNGRNRYQPPRPMYYYQFPYLIMSMLSHTTVKTPNGQALEDYYDHILATGNKSN